MNTPEFSDPAKRDEAAPPPRPASLFLSRLRRRLRIDKIAHVCVSFGGIAVILTILAILFVIVAAVAPLAWPASATLRGVQTAALPAPPLAIAVDDRRSVCAAFVPHGLAWVPLGGSAVPAGAETAQTALRRLLGEANIVSAAPYGADGYALGLSDGRCIPVRLRLISTFQNGVRGTRVLLKPAPAIDALTDHVPVRVLAYRTSEQDSMLVVGSGPRELSIFRVLPAAPDGNADAPQIQRTILPLQIEGELRCLAVDEHGEELYAGTSCGHIVRARTDSKDGAQVVERLPALGPKEEVTSLSLLLGHRTLISGGSRGTVSSWVVVKDDDGPSRLRRVHDFPGPPEAAIAIAPSRRNKGFLTLHGAGDIQLHYATGGRALLRLAATGRPCGQIALAPKGDGVLAVSPDGTVHDWDLHNPHPEVSLHTLFGRVWYEGYAAPEFVWQSSSGSDDFEPKFSLVPLLYGTFKGTFYALIIAVPIALLAALYASQFMHPTLRHTVKPIIELMAALPSVVLGFLAGLWLAPLVERILPGLLLSTLILPAAVLMSLLLWQRMPIRLRRRVPTGAECLLLLPVLILAGAAALSAGGWIEAWMPAGDCRVWLRTVLGIPYDQRNSLVVGFAMGFAVIPVIFTIAEDSLSNVPPHLSAGALALGATPWQSVLSVVLPAASPGIFSAVMIGFGRAIGETMIVLMATGNTPVMDPSLFSGFRALSANIAVELPEAPDGSTHFRVLFLAALLLFIFTFLVNTCAEVIRLRLRRRYSLL